MKRKINNFGLDRDTFQEYIASYGDNPMQIIMAQQLISLVENYGIETSYIYTQILAEYNILNTNKYYDFNIWITKPATEEDFVRLTIELDGKEYHMTEAGWKNDMLKSNLCALHGIAILRFTYEQVINQEAIGVIKKYFDFKKVPTKMIQQDAMQLEKLESKSWSRGYYEGMERGMLHPVKQSLRETRGLILDSNTNVNYE